MIFYGRLLRRILTVSLLTLANPGSLLASSPEEGVPLVRHFPPAEIGDGPQVLDAVQAPDGVLYFTSNRSILEYDGVGWRNARMGTARQLTVDQSGRVWVGCDGDLGYLDAAGRDLLFISLRDELASEERPTQEIRSTVALGDSVFFVYLRQLIRWSSDGYETWQASPGEEFQAAAAWNGELYVLQKGHGLRRWPEAATGPAPELEDQVRTILPLTEDVFLLGSDNGQVYRLQNGVLETYSTAAEERLGGRAIRKISWLRATESQEALIAVGSRGAGALFLNLQGEVVHHWDKSTGLPGNEVYVVLRDIQGSLWLGTSPGIARLSGAPLTFYDHSAESPKTLLDVERYNGALYVAAVNGAFRLEPSPGPEPASFAPVAGIANFVPHFAVTPHGLLAATSSSGLYQVEGLEARRLAPKGRAVAWREDDGVALVVAGDDLRVLIPDNSQSEGWRFRDYSGVIPETIHEIIPRGPGANWMITLGTRTLYDLSFPNGLEKPPVVTPFETVGPWPRGVLVDSRWGLRDGLAVYFWEDEKWRANPDMPLAEWIPPGKDRYELRATSGGDLWLTFRDRALEIQRRRDGVYQPQGRSIAFSRRLNFDTHADPGEPDVLWLATDVGPARLDTRFSPPPEVAPKIRFLPPVGTLEDNTDHPVLPYSAEAVRFEVALPYYQAEALTEYRFQLAGLNEGWSAWTDEPVKEYTNLPANEFRFRVEARNAGQSIGTAEMTFEVLPPWHQTLWFRALVTLTLVGLVFLYANHLRRKVKRERAIAERERAMSQQLQELDKLKDEFLANTSHELRTPLYGMTGLAESLLDGAAGTVSKEVQENLRMIVASGRRLSHLVNELLDFSKLRHKSLKLRRRPVELHGLVDVVLTLAGPLAAGKKLKLENSVAKDLPQVNADENRLQQILYNLVGNAIKFTDKGQVEVTAKCENDMVVVAVADTGIGIGRDDRERIFEAFEQADSSISRSHTGTGLGLPVTRQLVELHGGKIWLDSVLDKGSTFSFSLPVADEAAESLAPLSPSVLETPEESPWMPPPPEVSQEEENPVADANAARILAVDDEPVNRLVLTNYLRQENFDLTVAAGGEEALELLRKKSFDLVLLDIMMPRVSGYEVCRIIRESHPMEELPIIFLTAKNQAEDVVTGLGLGANDYLTKPVEKDELLARMMPHLKLLETHRNLDELVEEKISHISILEGILPICAVCKKIRDDEGQWHPLENYIDEHSEAQFSHGICPNCTDDYLNNTG